MAIQTLYADADRPFAGPNEGDAANRGDTWAQAVAKINANFAQELSPTLTAATFTAPGAPTTIGINPSSTSQYGTFYEVIGGVSGFDFSTLSAGARWNMFQTTLAPSVNTSIVWENLNSFLTLNGPGQAQGEINIIHAYFQANAGAVSTSSVETFEASCVNNGTLATFVDILELYHNGSAGTVTNGVFGAKCQLTNDNTTAGAVPLYAALDLEAMSGAGSLPTSYFLVRGADANAVLSTAGPASIGLLTASPAATFYVQGSGSTNATYALMAKNSSAAILFTVDNAGDVGAPQGVLNVGAPGTNWGKLNLFNLTSGTLQVSPPLGVALNGTVTVPNATTTLAGLAVAETFTATQSFNNAIVGLAGTATTAGGAASAGITFGSAGSPIGIYFGSGAPTISAPQGSLYLRTDGSSTSTRLYVNTNGSWTNVTTAA